MSEASRIGVVSRIGWVVVCFTFSFLRNEAGAVQVVSGWQSAINCCFVLIFNRQFNFSLVPFKPSKQAADLPIRLYQPGAGAGGTKLTLL